MAVLQETKWLGDEMYKVGESVLISAVPETDHSRQRPVVDAWRAGGCQRN